MGYRDEDAALFLQAVALQQGAIGASSSEEEEEEPEDTGDDPEAPLYGYPGRGADAPARTSFDVMEFAEALCAEYHWTFRDFMATPWKTLLGFSREAQRRHARERKAMEDARRNGGRPAPWDEAAWMGEAGEAGADGEDYQDYEEARLRALLAQDAPIPWERWNAS